ncbi:MAG: PQ-loop domain-containing transporter [Gammaproteobacteria bacterium]|nr:PQ-loop domain-containing transporter [Gammaproteobacteria bacterium]
MNLLREIIVFLFGVALFVNAALFVPQIYALYKTKDAKGVSFITFFGFSVLQLITICYGLIKQDYLMAGGYVLSWVLCIAISVMILLYRRKA